MFASMMKISLECIAADVKSIAAFFISDFVDGEADSSADISWEEEHVSSVASQIADRVSGLSLVSVPSLMKRVSNVFTLNSGSP